MKILYISNYDSNDIKALSGTIYYIRRMLENLGHDVIVIDDLKTSKVYKYFKKGMARLIGKSTLIEREPYVLKSFAKQLRKKTEGLEYDLVFSPSSLYYAYYKDSKPMVYYSDATFGGMIDYYIYRKDYTKQAIENGFAQEKRSVENSDLIILASEWAKRTAIECHGADPQKCVVINRGANIKHKLQREEIRKLIDAKVMRLEKKECEFIFLGTDWRRKGGSIAVEVVKLLNEKYGFKAVLHIVGCVPEIDSSSKRYIDDVGYLDKGNTDDYNKLELIFKNSAFLLLPTRREAQGISYAEACSWGVPAVGTNTGGVSGVICDGINGFLQKVEDKSEVYAERIYRTIRDSEEYRKLAYGTYDFFVNNLTWDAVGERINDCLLTLHRLR